MNFFFGIVESIVFVILNNDVELRSICSFSCYKNLILVDQNHENSRACFVSRLNFIGKKFTNIHPTCNQINDVVSDVFQKNSLRKPRQLQSHLRLCKWHMMLWIESLIVLQMVSCVLDFVC